uniref:Glycine rich superfamily member n=1 Tax=Rhipicephalus appendiculatus TaxID=34631 RepID=A0A131YCW3_RHIAP
MLRFACTLTLVFLCIMLSHGAPGLVRDELPKDVKEGPAGGHLTDWRTGNCDIRSCNATCTKESETWNDRDVYGKCDEKGICRCYHRDMCRLDKCKETCEEKHGHEDGLVYKCAEDACICTWNKLCTPTGCEAACYRIYIGRPNIEWWCEDVSCHCKWHGAPRNAKEGQQTTVTTSTENYGGKREQTIRAVDSDSFYLEKELHYPAAKENDK